LENSRKVQENQSIPSPIAAPPRRILGNPDCERNDNSLSDSASLTRAAMP
jgi:hypothetical protein